MNATGLVARRIIDAAVGLAAQWNWKTALLSSLFRSSIFFSVNLRTGWEAAVGAMATEFVYRSLTAGYYGTVTQRLSRVEPWWKATLLATVVLPAVQHALEAAVHLVRGTPRLGASIAASVAFTLLSTVFNLFAMRRGALVTGAGSQPLAADLARMPALVADFLQAAPTAAFRHIRALFAE